MSDLELHLLKRILKYLSYHHLSTIYGGEKTEDLREGLSYLISKKEGQLQSRYGIRSFEEWYHNATARREFADADGCKLEGMQANGDLYKDGVKIDHKRGPKSYTPYNAKLTGPGEQAGFGREDG